MWSLARRGLSLGVTENFRAVAPDFHTIGPVVGRQTGFQFQVLQKLLAVRKRLPYRWQRSPAAGSVIENKSSDTRLYLFTQVLLGTECHPFRLAQDGDVQLEFFQFGFLQGSKSRITERCGKSIFRYVLDQGAITFKASDAAAQFVVQMQGDKACTRLPELFAVFIGIDFQHTAMFKAVSD